MRCKLAWILTSVVLLANAPAHADSSPGRLLALAADVGLGGIGRTPVSTLHAGIDVREGGLALGFFGKLRLTMASDPSAIVHRRDYDEASDFVHIMRYFQYMRRFENLSVDVLAGELKGSTLGHGTLLRDYSNMGDADHAHAGARIRLLHRRVAFEALVDNLIAPRVVGARIALSPFSALNGLRFGLSAAVDPVALRQVALDHGGQRSVDEAFNLQGDTEPLLLMGLGLEWTFGSTARRRLMPYVDVNTSYAGVGLHAGAVGRFPLGKAIILGLQLEYRGVTGEYAPDYFTTFYDVDRHQASLGGSDLRTKLEMLRAGAYAGHGMLGQLELDAGAAMQIKAGYRYHPGPDAHRTWLRAVSTPWKKLQLGAMLLWRDIGSSSGLVAVAESRYAINDHLYALAQFSRSWSVQASTRAYGSLTVFNLGVGGSFVR
ncbi:MAG: hypothetical protein JRH20_10775 [Deltaproteobacteria bacterium]|nr:hypothetical protein [Deltaproteobacteria bacterium]